MKITKINIISIIVTVAGLIFGSRYLYDWWMKPIVTVDIQEYSIPDIYSKIVQRDKLSEIPRITTINLQNQGRSSSENLSLELKSNNNTTILGMDSEYQSKSVMITTNELDSGASSIKYDIEILRPNESISSIVTTNIRAGFAIKTKLMNRGDILTRADYDHRKEIYQSFIIIGFAILGLIIIAYIDLLKAKKKKDTQK